MSSVSVNAVATANLGPLNSVLPPATMNAPFGISQSYFNSGFGCGDQIQFSPTGLPQSCAGWTTFDQPFNANNMKGIVDGMNNGTYTSPGTTAGQSSLNFGNGNIGSTWSRLETLFNTMTANGNTWDAVLPVYGSNDCTPNGSIPIVGFATVRITFVGGPGNPTQFRELYGWERSTWLYQGCGSMQRVRRDRRRRSSVWPHVCHDSWSRRIVH